MKVIEVRDSANIIIELDNCHARQVEVPIQTGPPGLDAYRLALNNGFVGTLEEWLTSLSAYGIALSNGFVGSEEEWLESLKGSSGLDITSADEGYILTNNGTSPKWESLEDKLNTDSITWDLGDI